MKKLKLASHKGGGKWWFVSSITKWYTRGKYSHSELVMPDGTSFSSRQDGVSFKKIDYTKHTNRWDFVDIEVSDKEFNKIGARCNEIDGADYDWVGVALDCVLHTKLHREDQWWCSEAVAHALGINPELINPSQLHKIVNDYYNTCGRKN